MSGIVIDAAYPPPAVPVSVTGIMGYIGGPKATHIWSAKEWQPFASIRQFPVFVPDLNLDPITQAEDALNEVLKRGWAPHQADSRVIVFDLETDVNAPWWRTAAGYIDGEGFTAVVYGSLSTVLGNAAAHVIAADWDGIKQIPPGQTIHGVQYAANVTLGGAKVDYDLFDAWLMARGGVGPRHGA